MRCSAHLVSTFNTMGLSYSSSFSFCFFSCWVLRKEFLCSSKKTLLSSSSLLLFFSLHRNQDQCLEQRLPSCPCQPSPQLLKSVFIMQGEHWGLCLHQTDHCTAPSTAPLGDIELNESGCLLVEGNGDRVHHRGRWIRIIFRFFFFFLFVLENHTKFFAFLPEKEFLFLDF